jgi:hypothetical protein
MNNGSLSHLNVFTVEEFDAPTSEDPGRKAKSWTKIGVAFPHRDGVGYNVQLRCLPLDGRLVVLPATVGEEATSVDAPAGAAASIKGVRAAKR